MRLPNKAEKVFLKKEKMKATLDIPLKSIAESVRLIKPFSKCNARNLFANCLPQGILDEEVQLTGIKSGKLAIAIRYLRNEQVSNTSMLVIPTFRSSIPSLNLVECRYRLPNTASNKCSLVGDNKL